VTTKKGSIALSRMFEQVEKGFPKTTTFPAALERNRALQQALASKALEVAEEKWPGFNDLVIDLMNAELELMDLVGACA
jgi:hypothetical protein